MISDQPAPWLNVMRGNSPATAEREGSSNRKNQALTPTDTPKMAPTRVAPRQYSPISMAGANCATAEKDNKPMDARGTPDSMAWKYR